MPFDEQDAYGFPWVWLLIFCLSVLLIVVGTPPVSLVAGGLGVIVAFVGFTRDRHE